MAPSDKHIELQNMVTRWIGNRSFKMCGLPESNVVGYIADYVAIAGMHDAHHERYARHAGLKTKSMAHWKNNEYKIRGDIDRWYVCVFEVKVSRADFLNTFGGKDTPHAKARMEPVGTAHWVVADKGICKPEELPDFWGLLEPYGTGLTEKKIPKLNILPDSHIHAIAFDMLWLQMNSRASYHRQLEEMSKSIEDVHSALVRQKPIRELLRLSNIAVAACRGFAQPDRSLFEESTEAAAHTTRKGERSGGMSMKISPKNFFVS